MMSSRLAGLAVHPEVVGNGARRLRRFNLRVRSKITSDFGGSRRARCEARGGSIPHQWGCDRRARSRWPDAALPLRAGTLWLAGFAAHSSQTAAGMLV